MGLMGRMGRIGRINRSALPGAIAECTLDSASPVAESAGGVTQTSAIVTPGAATRGEVMGVSVRTENAVGFTIDADWTI